MSEPAKQENYEIIAQDYADPPVLTEEQKNKKFLIAIASMGEHELYENNGGDVIDVANAMRASEKYPPRVINSIYGFVKNAVPGDHCWTGHLSPLLFCLRDTANLDPGLPKPLLPVGV